MAPNATFGGVDLRDARALLGVGEGAGPAELRAAFRARLRATHPDLQGRDRGTAEVVAAYRLLTAALAAAPARGAATAAPAAGGGAAPPRRAAPGAAGAAGATAAGPVPAGGVVVRGATVVADLPAGDLVDLLVEAGEAIGHVAHVDRRSGTVEIVADVAGAGTCSVLVELQERGAGPGAPAVAACTAEPLGGGPPPDPVTVAALLADGLAAVTGR